MKYSLFFFGISLGILTSILFYVVFIYRTAMPILYFCVAVLFFGLGTAFGLQKKRVKYRKQEAELRRNLGKVLTYYRHEIANHLQLFISLAQLKRYEHLLQQIKKSDVWFRKMVYMNRLCSEELFLLIVHWQQEAGVSVRVYFNGRPTRMDNSMTECLKEVLSSLVRRCQFFYSSDDASDAPVLIFERTGKFLVVSLYCLREVLYPLPLAVQNLLAPGEAGLLPG